MLAPIHYLKAAWLSRTAHHEKWTARATRAVCKANRSPGGTHLCRGRRVGCVDLRPSLPEGLDEGQSTGAHESRKRKTLRPAGAGCVPGNEGGLRMNFRKRLPATDKLSTSESFQAYDATSSLFNSLDLRDREAKGHTNTSQKWFCLWRRL